MEDISKMFVEDALSNECAFNKKRMHNPPNREAAFSFAMHEIVLRMWGASLVIDKNPHLFKNFLESLKNTIDMYEELKKV